MRILIECTDNCYPKMTFKSLKDVRSWLFQHAKFQLILQGDLRERDNIGHDIDLRATNTFAIADYFGFQIKNL